ncbi:MAG: glycosyltransferase family 4 protein [Acidisphaera sp.]|nr:glycosyltransferase family 4 protein [Acidisphaera sp.]
MKVLVLTTMVPFVHGGAEELADHLVRNLRLAGMEAEAMALPFTWNPPDQLITEMLIARSIRILNADRLIALKFPAYLAAHPSKTVWLLHQFRQAYDLRDAGQSNIPETAHGETILRAVHRADTEALGSAQRLFTNARVTAERLRRYNGIAAEVLPPPVNDPELFTGGEAQGYVLATGRINAGKRQNLLIAAAALVPGARLVVAGPPDTPADGARLRGMVQEQGLADRVTLDLRVLERRELAALVCGAQAVAYLPFGEDSPGCATMEACQAHKPVITVCDAGGVLDLVRDGESGWVCAPIAAALAEVLAEVMRDPAECRRRGEMAHQALLANNLTWPATIERLLS